MSFGRNINSTFIALLTLVAISKFQSAASSQDITLRTVSSSADAITGGTVLIELKGVGASSWRAQLNGRDVTSSFGKAHGSNALLAILSGLETGNNLVTVKVRNDIKARLELINHSSADQLLKDAENGPFLCEAAANGLGVPQNADCRVDPVIQYYYKSAIRPHANENSKDIRSDGLEPGYKLYDPSTPLPPDVAKVEMSNGTAVNHIVRRERGTINRALYEIQFLHQPGDSLPAPLSQGPTGWNRRLVYMAGRSDSYRQGKLPPSGEQQELLLTQGYAVTTATPFFYDPNVHAQTLALLKEHFIKQHGEPAHTIGFAAGGTSIHQHLLLQNYPGLVDGVINVYSYPDLITMYQVIADCKLLDHALGIVRQSWSADQKAAISGFSKWKACATWAPARDLRPDNCDDDVTPPALRYNRHTNPAGVRCGAFDYQGDRLGRNSQTNRVNRPLDNVGVQYGLSAFQKGIISAEHFVELNELIGGLDEDGAIVPARMEGNAEALRRAYERGVVVSGRGLDRVPIIDWRTYLDDLGDVHDRVPSFIVRARLLKGNGSAANQVILTERRSAPHPEVTMRQLELVRAMDRWLDNIASDTSSGSPAERVARNKPADLSDGCVLPDGARVAEAATYGAVGACNQSYPSHAYPRMVAGSPLTADILKCALRPVDSSDYPAPLTKEQLARLRAVFPTGVCDYSRAGIGQRN